MLCPPYGTRQESRYLSRFERQETAGVHWWGGEGDDEIPLGIRRISDTGFISRQIAFVLGSLAWCNIQGGLGARVFGNLDEEL